MYFDPFPLTEYTINGKTETVIDIFRKVLISNVNKPNIFTEVLVQDSDSLESLAQEYYGDSSLSWIILVTNNIIDPNNEFILSTENLESLLNTKYSGNIAFFEENVQLQEGDILINVKASVPLTTPPNGLTSGDLETTKYFFVSNYNNEFRYARTSNETGNIVAGDKFAAYRKINDQLILIDFEKGFTLGQESIPCCVLPLKKYDTYISSPIYIYTSNNEVVSPYQKYNGGSLLQDYVNLEADGMYSGITNDNSFRDSVLYQHVMNNQNLSLLTFTIGEQVRTNNEKYRKIKLLPPNFVNEFINTFNELISRDDVRFRLITTKE
jgi:hypothetical protein